MNSSADFDSHETDFHQTLYTVRQRLEKAADKSRDGEQRKQGLRRVEMDLDEADEMISRMESSIDSMATRTAKAGFTTRLTTAKTELTRAKKTSRELHSQLSRTDLLASSSDGSRSNGFSYASAVKTGASSDDPYGQPTERTRLLAGTEALTDGQRRLANSQRIALESEDIGADILRSLLAQREQISGAQETLNTADQSIDRAGGTIKGMIRRMHQQRFVLGIMAFILILVVLFILYMKLWR